MNLSKATRFLLKYLAECHPRGVATITPIHGAQFDEQPNMVNMRGLVRRGWAREATEGNKPWGRKLGIFYITESGLQARDQMVGTS